MKMKAAVVRQATDPYKFEEVELAEPKNDEVLVRITASGLCHTDEFGRTLGMSPIVLGHEGAGIIEKLGENVKDFTVKNLTKLILAAWVLMVRASCRKTVSR